ncbi:MAG TPA: phosphoribosylglycinamide formyltransferase [Paracoccaceae bacterium]|nr:phosphoribosylglycinamide formyltransferase [Paracoccaceae bacterium]
MSRKRVAILISGEGTNMAALIRAMQASNYPAEPVLVLSNNPAAPGLEKAREMGVEAIGLDHRDFPDRTAFDAEMNRALTGAEADIVACAGFMRIMTANLVRAWEGRMLNIHPSLLPVFKGIDTHIRALAAGVAIHGCTVHEVVPELDSGRILGQAAVPVVPGDTFETLGKRVQATEHRLYPAVLAAFARNPLKARAEPLALLC